MTRLPAVRCSIYLDNGSRGQEHDEQRRPLWSPSVLHPAFCDLLCLDGILIGYPAFSYADDWGQVAALDIGSLTGFFHWLFAQHVEHGIPLHKLLQFSYGHVGDGTRQCRRMGDFVFIGQYSRGLDVFP